MDLYTIFFNDYSLNVKSVSNDCAVTRWAPLMAYKKIDDHSMPRVIAFTSKGVADKFLVRNFTKKMLKNGWVRGTVLLTKDDVKAAEDNGLQFDIMNWPRKIYGCKDYYVCYTIHNFVSDIEVSHNGRVVTGVME